MMVFSSLCWQFLFKLCYWLVYLGLKWLIRCLSSVFLLVWLLISFMWFCMCRVVQFQVGMFFGFLQWCGFIQVFGLLKMVSMFFCCDSQFYCGLVCVIWFLSISLLFLVVVISGRWLLKLWFCVFGFSISVSGCLVMRCSVCLRLVDLKWVGRYMV